MTMGKWVSAALFAIACGAILAAVAGAAGNGGTTFTFKEDVHAVIDPAVCSEISSAITLDGTASGWAHASVDARGIVHVNFGEAINGTGVDEDGNTYRFSYHDAGSQTFAGFPASLRLTDHFNLVGAGGSNRIHTFFNAVITFQDENDPGTFVPGVVIGDPEHCDPL
jgi:hypothetical protein